MRITNNLEFACDLSRSDNGFQRPKARPGSAQIEFIGSAERFGRSRTYPGQESLGYDVASIPLGQCLCESTSKHLSVSPKAASAI
jgi:hypothetical protein